MQSKLQCIYDVVHYTSLSLYLYPLSSFSIFCCSSPFLTFLTIFSRVSPSASAPPSGLRAPPPHPPHPTNLPCSHRSPIPRGESGGGGGEGWRKETGRGSWRWGGGVVLAAVRGRPAPASTPLPPPSHNTNNFKFQFVSGLGVENINRNHVCGSI